MTTPTGPPGQPKRTLPDARYGEQKSYDEIQNGALVGGTPPALTPLSAPSARPDEPVTAGAALGPGPGPEALGIPDAQAEIAADLAQVRRYLPTFIARANHPDTSQSFRDWVRLLRNEIR